MTALLLIEWRRMLRERTFLVTLGVLSLVLGAAAVAGGLAAREWRAGHAAAQAAWADARAKAAAAAEKGWTGDAGMMAAFQFARAASPPAVLPPLGGLSLGVSPFRLHSPDAHVTVESRHTDSRRSQALANPLLPESGTPDFAVAAALLVPLAVLGACAGMLQQSRESGTWRLVAARSCRPAAVLAAGIAVRTLAIFAAVSAASALAFTLDPGSTAEALAAWLLTMAAYASAWGALAALSCLLPVPSAAALLLGTGTWIVTTFAVPSLLSASDRGAPAPSRLQAIAQVREAQQDAEARMDELLVRWYAEHPVPPGRANGHTWPVNFMPRYIEQERQVRPIVAAFDRARTRRHDHIGWLAAASPALAVLQSADGLAGISPRRLEAHNAAVNSYEDRWRGFFVPKIMAYRGLTPREISQVPVFEAAKYERSPWREAAWLPLGLLAALLAATAFLFRGRARQP